MQKDMMGRTVFNIENCDNHEQSGDYIKQIAINMHKAINVPFIVFCTTCEHGFGFNNEGKLFESYSLDGKWYKSQIDIIEAQLRNEGIII